MEINYRKKVKTLCAHLESLFVAKNTLRKFDSVGQSAVCPVPMPLKDIIARNYENPEIIDSVGQCSDLKRMQVVVLLQTIC